MKLFITERNNLNEKLFQQHPEVELTQDPEEADFLLSQSTVRYPMYAHKTIYLAIEPPRSEHRIWCYNNFDKFKLVVCHDPDKTKDNQMPFTPDDSCQYYPTRADAYPFMTREDTTLKNRGVFYAGMINIYDSTPDACGGINITPLRVILGEFFQKEEPFKKDSKIIGIGWNGQTTKEDMWRAGKHEQIMESKCDFVLALENTIYPNYLYEKIWDGFATDRVTMYLGDSRIEKHIPLNCFIDLRPFMDLEKKQFNLQGLSDLLKNMTQEEYDEILNNARVFRETAVGNFRKYMDGLTNKLIEYMLENAPKD